MRASLLCSGTLLFSIVYACAPVAVAQDAGPGTIPETPIAAAPSGFFPRLAHFYHDDWNPPAGLPVPAPARRGPPSPLDSPPFPSADWSYGGSPVLGEPDTNSYPLMTALNVARSRTKIYGWVEPSVNGSTSGHSNSPEANDAYSNRLELNQAVIYVERLPDSVQRKHIDYGYHFTAFYGTDYRYTTNKGYLSDQLIKHNHQ